MGEKPVGRLIFSMSLPMALSMTINSLYNIVDSLFVSRIGDKAMTALSIVFPVQNFVNAVAIGFAIGLNAVISRLLGAGEERKADCAATLGLILNIIHGILLTLICSSIMPLFLSAFTADEEVIALGLEYSLPVLGFSVVVTAGIAFEKIFQSVGKMNTTMCCMALGCIVNIVLDPLMIFGLGPLPALGILGAALATGIGQFTTLAAYILLYIARRPAVKIRLGISDGTSETVKSAYAVGIPATLNLALPSLLIAALNAMLSDSPAHVLVLGVYYKLQTFLYLPSNGVIQGIRPLMGYNLGAKKYDRLKKIYMISQITVCTVMTLGTVLCLALPARLMGLFSQNAETVAIGARALRIISAGFILSAFSVVVSGALEGLGMGVPSLVISLCRYVVILIPIARLLVTAAGSDAVWHAFWISELLSAGISILIYRKKTDFNGTAV